MAKGIKQKCDFCGRTEDQVDILISGLNACICNECAEQVNEILAGNAQ